MKKKTKKHFNQDLISQINNASAMINAAGRTGQASWIMMNSTYGAFFSDYLGEQERLAKLAERLGKIDNLLGEES